MSRDSSSPGNIQDHESVNMHAHTNGTPHLPLHTHTHSLALSVGDCLLCRFHVFSVAMAAQAPGLCSRSNGSPVSGVLAWWLLGRHLSHSSPLAQFFTWRFLSCFQLAFGGGWATGQRSGACIADAPRLARTRLCHRMTEVFYTGRDRCQQTESPVS